MTPCFAPWAYRISPVSRSVDLLDGDGRIFGQFEMSVWYWEREIFARHIVACVNALRGFSTESIEAMQHDRLSHVIAKSWAEVRAHQLAAVPVVEPVERVIEYDVPVGAGEEGRVSGVSGLEDVPAGDVRRLTHEQAAAEGGAR